MQALIRRVFSKALTTQTGTLQTGRTLMILRTSGLRHSRSSSGTIYAATYGAGVFKTSDGGSNWTGCDTTNMTNLNVVSLSIDPNGKLYAGTEAGVFVSADGCSTWTEMSNGLP